jgi:hypothetical protein
VANFQPTSNQKKQRYRTQLRNASDRAAFDKLAKLMDMPRNDLDWHYDVGQLVHQLEPVRRRGKEWLLNLGNALGPSTASLRKLLQFTALYAKRQDFKDLERMGVNWTRLRLVFPVEPLKSRHALLRKAKKEGWNDEQLRVTVQQIIGPKRRGVGGRPRIQPQNYGAEPTLLTLARLSRAWLAYHDMAWSEVTTADWKGLVDLHATNDRKKLQALLVNTHADVTKLAEASQEVGKTLERLHLKASAP